ncbi:4Fe-4S dicluster domain-containing protein [Desulfosporosinus sp. SYSU MS00001]|uniref:4Fe-4S dicluster domain-containing protein n=1 Tax=Desulfosporosinus sp. SYSU MS00001 TaxID=3416284 RepID=UPI003CE7C077
MNIPVFLSCCEACVNVCLFHAITMKEIDVGFRYRVLQKELCVSCGLCFKKCPVFSS